MTEKLNATLEGKKEKDGKKRGIERKTSFTLLLLTPVTNSASNYNIITLLEFISIT